MSHRAAEALAGAAARLRELATLGLVLALPLVFNPYSFEAFEYPKVLFFRAAVGVIVSAFALERLLGRGEGRLFDSSPLDVPVAAYATAWLLATALSVDPARSFWGTSDGHGTLTLLCLLGFYFVLSRTVRSREATHRLFDAVLLGTIPVSLYGLVQYAGIDPIPWTTDSISAVLSTMGRSNFLGAYLAMVVPLTLLRIASGRGAASWRLYAILALQAAVLALTQARAAWLSVVGGAACFTALVLRGERRRFQAVTLGLLALGIFLVLPLGGPDAPSLESEGTRAGPSFSEMRAHTIASRWAIWRCTLSLLPHRWLLGYGPETFSSVFASRCPIAPPGWIVDDPHNVFLGEAMSAGVVGVGAFTFLIAAFFWTALGNARGAREEPATAFWAALAACGFAFLIQAQLNPDVIVITMLFWAFLAIASGVTAGAEVRYNAPNEKRHPA